MGVWSEVDLDVKGPHDVLVEVTLEVAPKPVEHRVLGDVEAELGVSRIVDNFSLVWMLESEQCLWGGELEPILQEIYMYI